MDAPVSRPSATGELGLSEIKIGKRHRKDNGDIAALARSIEDVGLLHPVVVTPEGKLIAGARRIAAFNLLGRDTIPIRVIDIDKMVRGELAENVARKDFSPSEAVAIAEAVKRHVATPVGRPNGNGGNLPPLKGKTRDKVAVFTGMSPRTLDKATALVKAAKAEPDKYAKLVSDMDRSGRVNGPYKRLLVARKTQDIRKETPGLPNKGPYRVIVADPPWPYDVRQEDPSHRGTYNYPQMSIAAICALDVASIAHDDSVLFLWSTNHHLREAFAVLDAWGFQYKTNITWAKDRMGTGHWLRGQTEQCLLAVRGNPTIEVGMYGTLIQGKVRAHSQKPESFYAFVEGYVAAPRYAELFSRQQRKNWDGHGDDAGARGDVPVGHEAGGADASP